MLTGATAKLEKFCGEGASGVTTDKLETSGDGAEFLPVRIAA